MIPFEKVDEIKLKLGDAAAHIIAKDLDIRQWDERTMMGCSPFSRDSDPSFKWYKDEATFKDFSTQRTYGIIDHFMSFYELSRNESIKRLFDLVGEPYKDKDFLPDKNTYKNIVMPSDEPENNRAIVNEYAFSRGISQKTLDFCNVKQSDNGKVAFQLFDQYGIHCSTKYRAATDSCVKQNKWRWQSGADNKALGLVDVLYGMDKVDVNLPLVIVEGFFDRLAVVEAGFLNVVSIPGGADGKAWIDYNESFLKNCKDIVLWFDNDDAGRTGAKNTAQKLGEYRIRLVTAGTDVLDTINDYFAAKGIDSDKADANNVLLACGSGTVLKLIETAKIIENPKLKRLFEYTPVNIFDLPRVTTGFKKLDRIVSGNFDKNFIVISGFSGGGKTTLVAQMGIIAPLEAGEKVMIFSGEANGEVLLGTTYRPLAGRNHIIEWDNSAKDIPNSFSVTKEAMDKIKETYYDKIWNYDDGQDLVASSKEILEAMEYSYKRMGITNFVIDNLMCISYEDIENKDDEDKYNAQFVFCRKLKAFTRNYGAKVFLVAHSKKPNGKQEHVDMYSVSGASEIVNLADRGYSTTKIESDPEGFNCNLFIMKDRVGGKTGSYVKLYFDIATNRYYSDEDELFASREWEKLAGIEYPKDIVDKLVAKKDYRSKLGKEAF